MSTVQDIFAATRKILLISEELNRLSDDTKALSNTVRDHEIRLVRIETTLDIAQRGSKLTLPGN